MKTAVKRMLSVLLAATLIMGDWGGSFATAVYADEPVEQELTETAETAQPDVSLGELPNADDEITTSEKENEDQTSDEEYEEDALKSSDGIEGEYTAEQLVEEFGSGTIIFITGDTTIKISDTTDVTIKGIQGANNTSGTLTFTGSDKGKIRVNGPIWFRNDEEKDYKTNYNIVLNGGHIITDSGPITGGDLTVKKGFLEIIHTNSFFSPLDCRNLLIEGGKVYVEQHINRMLTHIADNLTMTGGVFWYDCFHGGIAPAVRITGNIDISGESMFYARKRASSGAAVIAENFSIKGNSIFRAVSNTYGLLLKHNGNFTLEDGAKMVGPEFYKKQSAGTFSLYPGSTYPILEYDTIFETDTNAVAKEVNIYQKSKWAEINVDKTSCSFGKITYGDPRPEKKTITVKNVGDVPMWITRSETEYFELSELSADYLLPGESATFTAQPKDDLAAADYKETVTIQSNYTYKYVKVELSYKVKANDANIEVIGDTSADFWRVYKDYFELPDAKVFTVKNTGIKDVTFTIPKTDAYDVTFKDDKLDLAVGQETTITICPKKGLGVGNYSVDPFYIRTKQGAYIMLSLSFAVEDSKRTELSVEKDLYDFGSAATGYKEIPEAQAVVIKNTGNVRVKIVEVTQAERWNLGKLSKDSLKPGETATFTLRPKASLSANNADLDDIDTINVNFLENGGGSQSRCGVKAQFVVGAAGEYTATELKKICPDTGSFYIIGDLTVTLEAGDDVTIPGITNKGGDGFTFTVKGSDEGTLRLAGSLIFKENYQNVVIENGHVIVSGSMNVSNKLIQGNTSMSKLTVNGGYLEVNCRNTKKDAYALLAYELEQNGGTIDVINVADETPCVYVPLMFNLNGGIFCCESRGKGSAAIRAVNGDVYGTASMSAYAASNTGYAVDVSRLCINGGYVFRAEGGEYAVNAPTFYYYERYLSEPSVRTIVLPSGGKAEKSSVVDDKGQKAKLVLICDTEFERRSEIEVTPSSLYFEYVKDSVPAGKDVTVENKGTIFLGLNSLDSDTFEAKDYSRHIVLPGKTASINIAPKAKLDEGEHNYELAIPTDFTADKNVNIRISVLKKVFAFTVSPNEDAIWETAVSQEKFPAKTFTIKNTGNQYLDFKAGIKLYSYSYFDLWVPEFGLGIYPGDSFSISVTPKSQLYPTEMSTQLFVKPGQMSESDTVSINLKAEVKNPPSGYWMKLIPDQTYTGKEVRPVPVVYEGKYKVSPNEYTVSYKNNVKAASKDAVGKNGKSIAPTVIITGKNNYTGTVSQTFTINPTSIENAFTDEDPAGTLADDPEFAHQSLYANGNVQKGKFTIKYSLNGKTVTLKNNTDYTLYYPHTDKNSTDPVNLYDENAFKTPGIYEVKVIGKGNYTGTKTLRLKIVDKAGQSLISGVTISKIPDQSYTGADFILEGEETDSSTRVLDKNGNEFSFVLKDNAKKYTLVYGTDYRLSYSSNREVGKAKVTITGIGNYTGMAYTSFNIKGTKLSKVKTEGYVSSVSYTGSNIKQPMRFYYVTGTKGNSKKNYLWEGIDYEVEYVDHPDGFRELGKYTIKYKGKGGFTGTVTKTMTITGINFKNVKVPSDFSASTRNDVIYDSARKGFVYTGWHNYVAGHPDGNDSYGIDLTYKAAGSDSRETLVLGRDYRVSYKNDIKAGKATVTFTGKGKYTGSVKKTFKIVPYKILKSDTSLEIGFEVEDARGQYCIWEPEVIPKFSKTKDSTTPNIRLRDKRSGEYLVNGKDYTLTYKNNKKITGEDDAQRPYVIINGKGNYAGSDMRDFTISETKFSNAVVKASDVIYKENTTGLFKKTSVTVTDANGKKLKAGTDYYRADDSTCPFKYTYAKDWYYINAETKERVDVTAGTEIGEDHILEQGTPVCVTVTGTGDYKGTIQGYFRIIRANINDKSVKITIDPKVFTGADIELDNDDITVLIVKNKKAKPIPVAVGEEITVVPDSYEDNYKKGTAKVVLQGNPDKGYIGTRTVTFKINARPFGNIEILKAIRNLFSK